MQNEIVDCLIVGSGPVGLTLGCQLHQYGTSFRILDKLEEPVRRTKAAAVWSRTAEIFSQMELIEPLIGTGLKAYGASFFADGKRIARLNLDTIDCQYNYVLMTPQHRTEKVLRDYLQEQSISIEYSKEVSVIVPREDCVEVHLECGEIVHARWVVGCDGANSTVRRSLGLSFDGQELDSQWVVGDLELEGLPYDDELLLMMHKDGPTGLFPLGDSLYRVVAEVDQRTEDASAELQQLVKLRVGGEKLRLGKVIDAGYFTIAERQVEQYRQGRVFIAGDAAHVQSPLGGQGMNTGIQDANNLAWKLAMVTGRAMRERLLDTYHEERHPIGEWLVEATSRGTAMITNRQPLVLAFRKQAARLVASLPPVHNKIRSTLSELEIHYRRSSLSQEPAEPGRGWRFNAGVKAGERAPDGPVMAGGEERLLSEFLRGCQLHLLLFDSEQSASQTRFEPLLKALGKNHPNLVRPLLISLREDNAKELDCPCLQDSEEKLHQLYAATEPSAYLVRPDGYVAYRCQPLDQVELLNYLDSWALF